MKSPQLPIYFRPFIGVLTPLITGRGPTCIVISKSPKWGCGTPSKWPFMCKHSLEYLLGISFQWLSPAGKFAGPFELCSRFISWETEGAISLGGLELTHPTMEKGKSSTQKCLGRGYVRSQACNIFLFQTKLLFIKTTHVNVFLKFL